MTKDYHRTDSLVKQVDGHQNWVAGTTLRIVKRKRRGNKWYGSWSYFVVAVGDPVGYGCWLRHDQIQPLSALELLAAQAETM